MDFMKKLFGFIQIPNVEIWQNQASGAQFDVFVRFTVPAFQMKNTKKQLNVHNPKYTPSNPTLTSCG